MFGLFNKKKKIIQQSKKVELLQPTVKETLENRFSFTFKNDVDRETFKRNTVANIKNRLMPIEVEETQIIGYSRYKGVDIGIYRTAQNGFGFYMLKRIPIRLFGSFVRKDEPANSTFTFQKDILNFMEIEVVNPLDKEYIEKILDMYLQKYLLLLIPQLVLGDRIFLNRNGMSLETNKELSNIEIDLIMSFIYQMIDSVKREED